MTNEPTAQSQQYFTSQPGGEPTTRQFTFEGPRGPLTLTTGSGVFSQHGLDKGTSVLLQAMKRFPLPDPGAASHLLDLGCGTGALGLVLAAQHPQCFVHAIDINERALSLCRENASANSLKNITVSLPSEVDSEIRFERIWSNPPIRIGKDALHELLLTWLQRLTPSGRACFVVNKNLGGDSLAKWFSDNRYPVQKLKSSNGFRVLVVSPQEN